MKPLEQQLAELQTELKSHFEKAAEQERTRGAISEEAKKQIDAIQKQVDAIDAKLIDRREREDLDTKSITDVLKENEDVARLVRDRKGRAVVTFTGQHARQLIEGKAVSGLGVVTPGVIDADRTPGIVLEARRKLTVRNVLAARPTTLPLVYWVKVNHPLSVASPAAETSTKFENQVTFTTANSAVKTIATFIKASRQALDDFGELSGFLQTGLPYYVNRAEETQLLSGDNTGENLNGLITQATAFDASLLTAGAGYTRIDQLGAAIQQIGEADEIDPGFVILHKRDWWKIRRTKDSFGRYILGDPQSQGNPTIWDLNVVATNSIASGTFLVGSSEPSAAEIRDRMEMQVEFSTEDGDNFKQNMVTIRAEKRLVLTVMRPASYITGTFATSPSGQ